jgi:hypothetical protein
MLGHCDGYPPSGNEHHAVEAINNNYPGRIRLSFFHLPSNPAMCDLIQVEGWTAIEINTAKLH